DRCHRHGPHRATPGTSIQPIGKGAAMSAIASAQTLSALALFTGPGQDFAGVAGQPLLTAQVAGDLTTPPRLPQTTRGGPLAKALLAGIRGGQLVARHSGHCAVTATLAIEKTDVITKQASFQLPGVIPLGAGIRLVDATAYRTGPAYAETATMPAAGEGPPGTYPAIQDPLLTAGSFPGRAEAAQLGCSKVAS